MTDETTTTDPHPSNSATGPRTGDPMTGPRTDSPQTARRTDSPATTLRTGSPETARRTGGSATGPRTGTTPPAPPAPHLTTPDHLRTWLAVRAEVPWHRARPVTVPAEDPLTRNGTVQHIRTPTRDATAQDARTPTRDGPAHDIRTHDHARSSRRAERLLAALARARADATSSVPLTFALLGTWQRHVLGTPEDPPFRSDPAYAKSGRERYGIAPDLPARLDTCLAEAADPGLPLTARAARAYLDVCFFHPFDDGNARAAFLTLTFVLARAGVTLDQVGPVRRVARYADDPEGALALADLLAVLITATAARRAPGGPGCRPSPARSALRPPPGTA